MKKTVRKILLCVLLAAIALLAGCKKKNEVEFDKNVIYKETNLDISLPDGMYVSGSSTNGEKVVIYGTIEPEVYDENYTQQNVWVEFDIKTGDTKIHNVDFEGPEISGGYINECMILANGNILMTYSTYFEDDSDPDNYVWLDYNYIELLDATGKTIAKSLVDKLGFDWIGAVTSTPDGKIIVNCDNEMYLLDETLKVEKKAEISENCWVDRFVNGKDGKIYAYGSFADMYGNMVPISLPSLEIGAVVEFPFESMYTPMGGSDAYEWLFYDDNGVYGYNNGDTDVKRIFSFVDSDVAVNYFDSFYAVDDKTFIGTTTDWSSNRGPSFETYCYTKVNPEDIVDKKIISLGCVFIDTNVRQDVVDFNKHNDEYRIVVKDYSQYSTDDDYMAGYNRFDSDIMTGQAPDIIVTSGSAIGYIQKGVLKDLRPYAEKDPDIDLNDIFPNIIETLSKDGKLYGTAPYFMLEGYAAKKSLIGDRESWTLKEMMDFADTLPANMSLLGDNVVRESIMYSFMYNNYNDFIDPVTHKCSFDSEEFVQILEFAKRFPAASDDMYENIDYEKQQTAWRENRAALYDFFCYDVHSYKELLRGYMGEPVNFIGYPSNEGKGINIQFYRVAAMTSKASYPDACWEFVKKNWTKEVQDEATWGIPVSMSRFDELTQELKERPYNTFGDEVEYYDDYFWVGGDQIPMAPLTDAEIEEFKDFVKSATKQMNTGNDEQIFTIVEEETAPFFEGQKTAEEVAKIIQSRITIYVNEKQ